MQIITGYCLFLFILFYSLSETAHCSDHWVTRLNLSTLGQSDTSKLHLHKSALVSVDTAATLIPV